MAALAFPVMASTYASVSDFEAYSDGWTTTDAAELEAVLEDAERDIDRLIPYQGARPTSQLLKFSNGDLTAMGTRDRTALMRATCAQAEYRIQMGPAFFRKAQHASVSGPKFSTSGMLPRIGPKVAEELAAFSRGKASWGLVRR